MSYNKKIWANGDLITKEGMNNIEYGIYDAHDKINAISNKVEENTTDTSTARQDISDIKLQIGTEELTTKSKKLKGAINELGSQIKDIENEKLDKNGIITMANIGQDIKEAMTGGSVAVVGKNTILTENIVNKQVTEDKVNFLNGYENIWTFGDNLDFKITQLNAYQNRPYTITEGFVPGDTLLFSIGEAINCTNNAIAELKIYKEDGTVLNSLWMTKTNRQQKIKVLDDSVKITVVLFLSQETAFSEPCTVSFKNIKLIKNGDLSYEIADNIKVDYSNLINVKITKDDTDIFDPCLNLYDYSTSLLNKSIDKNNGQISDVDNFILSDYIEVKSENEYYKRFYGDVVFFDSSKLFMSGMSSTGKMNFTTPKNCKYIRVNIAGIDNLQYEVVAPSTADHTFVMPTGTQFIKNDMIDVRKFYNWYGKNFVSFGHSIVAMQRWQQYVADYFGLKHTCCGQGGSPVAGESFTGDDGEVKIPMWKDERINAIPEDTDLILILCGLNDYETCKDNMGNINDTDTNTFYGAYNTMLSKLYTRCPDARIVIMNDLFRAIQPGINREVEDNTRDAIRLISKKYNYPLIDSTEYGINDLNYTVFYEANDPVHPSYVGGKRIADVVIGKLKTISPYNSELN